MLDSAPYQLRPDSVAAKNPYAKNTYGGTIGGPVKIRGIYDGTRKTNFILYLQRQSRQQPVRSVRHRADRGLARRRLLRRLAVHAHRSGDRPAVRQQPDSGSADQPVGAGAPELHPVTQSRRRLAELSPHRHRRVVQRHRSACASRTTSRRPRPAGVAPAAVAAVAAARAAAAAPADAVGAAPSRAPAVNMTAQLQYRHADNDILNIMPELGGQSIELQPRGAGLVQHPAQAHDARAQRQLLVDLGDDHQPFRRRQNVVGRGRASRASRPIRSTTACRRCRSPDFRVCAT